MTTCMVNVCSYLKCRLLPTRIKIMVLQIPVNILIRSYSNQTRWKSIVGLEVHAQLQVESKLFSSSGTQFATPANSNVNLLDAAIPGALPVLNKKCVELAVLTSLALSCQLNPVSFFDRKHYFYSDLPAGYQITQQRQPIAKSGAIRFHVYTPGVHKTPYLKMSKLKQVQLEQDSGKSLHDEAARTSLVDLNRAGMALIELVFEPDLSDGEEAAALIKELTLVLQAVGSCSCRMEEGALRVDANVSVNKEGSTPGIRTEIKNIGSVRGVANAVKYEVQRQISVLESGGVIVNETRGWDAIMKKTVSMRDKEEKQDYRYMPEPNLPPLRIITDEVPEVNPSDLYVLDVRGWKKRIPELPESQRSKLIQDHKLSELQAISLVGQPVLYKHFSEIISQKDSRDPTKIYNLLVIDFLGALHKKNVELNDCSVTHSCLGEVLDLLEGGRINSQTCSKVLDEMVSGSQLTPTEFVTQHNLEQISDPAQLANLCGKVLERCPKEVAAYRKGKTKVFQRFMMELNLLCNDRANGKLAKKIMTQLLDSKT